MAVGATGGYALRHRPPFRARAGSELIQPVRLEPEVLDFLATRAEARGTTVNQLVNQLLKNDIESIRAAVG